MKEKTGKSTAMKPLVSILIPAYNTEEWISQTIESAIAQTWSHKEIVVVDHGSTDRTGRSGPAVRVTGSRKRFQLNTKVRQRRANHAMRLSPGGDYCIDRAEFKPTSLWQDLSPAEWLHRKMADNLYMQTATWLTSKEQTEAAGPWDTHLLSDDDVEYSCRVLLASEGTRFVPEARVFCRNTPSVTA